jgi:hypothetical protein
MDSVSPVWTEAEVEIEKVIALDQPQYFPIIVLPVRYGDGSRGVAVRFRLSEADRKAVAAGADLVITEMSAGSFTPISLELIMPNKGPNS